MKAYYGETNVRVVEGCMTHKAHRIQVRERVEPYMEEKAIRNYLIRVENTKDSE